MSLSTFDKDVSIIAKLDDDPNATGGLTAAELKSRFDEAANIIKSWLNNTHIPELQKLENLVDGYQALLGTVKTLETIITPTDDAIPTSKAVLDAISEIGGGDMLRSVYDTDKDGVIDVAATAKKLASDIIFSLTGGVTASGIFDGSGDFSLNVTEVDPEKLAKPTPISKGGTGGTDPASACEGIGALSRNGGNVTGPTSFSGTLTANEKIILSPYTYGTALPDAGTPGRLFFLLV